MAKLCLLSQIEIKVLLDSVRNFECSVQRVIGSFWRSGRSVCGHCAQAFCTAILLRRSHLHKEDLVTAHCLVLALKYPQNKASESTISVRGIGRWGLHGALRWKAVLDVRPLIPIPLLMNPMQRALALTHLPLSSSPPRMESLSFAWHEGLALYFD